MQFEKIEGRKPIHYIQEFSEDSNVIAGDLSNDDLSAVSELLEVWNKMQVNRVAIDKKWPDSRSSQLDKNWQFISMTWMSHDSVRRS